MCAEEPSVTFSSVWVSPWRPLQSVSSPLIWKCVPWSWQEDLPVPWTPQLWEAVSGWKREKNSSGLLFPLPSSTLLSEVLFPFWCSLSYLKFFPVLRETSFHFQKQNKRSCNTGLSCSWKYIVGYNVYILRLNCVSGDGCTGPCLWIIPNDKEILAAFWVVFR